MIFSGPPSDSFLIGGQSNKINSTQIPQKQLARMPASLIQQPALYLLAGKHRAKLSQSDVISIFQAKATRIQATVIARSYGVSEKAVRDIWSGRTWAKETWHLNPSRTLIVKQTGRPKGSRDSRPRQKRMPRCSLPSVRPDELVDSDDVLQYLCDCGDESEIRSSHQHPWPCDDAASTSESPVSIAASDCDLLTLDEQLHRWGGVWCDPHNSDPFEHDWQPAPCVVSAAMTLD